MRLSFHVMEVPHGFKIFKPILNGIQQDFSCMQYRFLSTNEYLPHLPSGSSIQSSKVTNILIPHLAAVGGMTKFAKDYLKIDLAGATESERQSELQNRLVGKGYPAAMLQLLDMFEGDTVNLLLQRFANEDDNNERGLFWRSNGRPSYDANGTRTDADDDDIMSVSSENVGGNSTQLKLKTAVTLSDFDKLDINVNKRMFYNDEHCGLIRVLIDLPRMDDEALGKIIDIGSLVCYFNF